jgi:streptomycin 6-kinase
MSDQPARTLHSLRKLAEGAEAEIFEWEDGAVLRLFRGARPDEWLEHEAAAMRAGHAALPLVPSILGRVDIEGRSGIVMERIDGDDLITIMSKRPWWMWRAGTISGNVHAQLHEVVAPPEVQALADIVRMRAADPRVPPYAARAALTALAALPEGDRLLHGDLHPGNILMSSRGPVVIDWPNATRGDPHADVARTLLLVGHGTLPPGSPLFARVAAAVARRVILVSYRRAYAARRPLDPELLRRWSIVNAAIRFAEDIPGERDALLRRLADLGVTE